MNSDTNCKTPTAECGECGKVFSKHIYRNKHVRLVHKVNYKGEQISTKIFTCGICNKDFGQKQYLQKHLSKFHLSPEDSDEVYECNKCSYKTVFKTRFKMHYTKVHKNKKKDPSKQFHCNQCKSSFTLLKYLKFHERRVHNIGERLHQQVKRKCPMCPFSSCAKDREEINKHLENHHKINLKWRRLNFTTVLEFHEWKTEIECQSIAKYSKRYATSTRLQYTCHRNGTYQSKINCKRRRRVMGSCKIGAYCPSEIKVKILPNGSVEIMYLQTHVGHTCELKNIHLEPEHRKSIDTELVNETPHEEILNTITGSVANNELKMIQLMNSEDILNIESEFNINSDAVKDPFDPVTIEAWVNELKVSEETALLVYKPQGEVCVDYSELKEDDFVLIFMSEAQNFFLSTHGHDTICIDRTHNVNNCNFQLYTLLILDESREGLPVAFMFSNRGDDIVLSLFFNKLKEVTGEMSPTIFMSDVGETFYSSWSKVMGPVQLRLFCTWLVLDAWRINLNKIQCKSKGEEVYKILKTLLCEMDIDKFNKLLEAAIAKFVADEDIKDFGKYFTECYVRGEQYKQWAYCFRINAGINTNMSSEIFNRLLKHCYLRGKQVKPLDNTLFAVLNLLRDKLFDYLIKMSKEKLFRKLQALRERHKTSLMIPESSVSVLNDCEWYVLSSKVGEMFRVKKVKECKKCQLQCLHCNSCFHEYICTCLDSGIKNNMCKHIHATARYVHVMDRSGNTSTIEANDFQMVLQNDEQQELEVNIFNVISTEEVNEDYNRHRSEYENTVQDIIEFLQHRVTTIQQMDYIEKQWKQIMTKVDAMESTG